MGRQTGCSFLLISAAFSSEVWSADARTPRSLETMMLKKWAKQKRSHVGWILFIQKYPKQREKESLAGAKDLERGHNGVQNMLLQIMAPWYWRKHQEEGGSLEPPHATITWRPSSGPKERNATQGTGRVVRKMPAAQAWGPYFYPRDPWKKSVACNSNVGWPGQEGPGGSRRIPGTGYLASQSRSVKDPVTHTKTRWAVLEE